MHYDSKLSLREARALYFKTNNFGDGGYTDKWAKFKAGPIPLAIPNTAGRIAALKRHDLHHVLTGYAADWTGEGEISAWELASGCRDFYAAWVLNLMALTVGIAIAPMRCARAFRRGWDQVNLYGDVYSEALLDQSVGDVRARLRIS